LKCDKKLSLVTHRRKKDFRHSEFLIKIRLNIGWVEIINKANLTAEFYGNWNFKKYSKSESKKLIVVAKEMSR